MATRTSHARTSPRIPTTGPHRGRGPPLATTGGVNETAEHAALSDLFRRNPELATWLGHLQLPPGHTSHTADPSLKVILDPGPPRLRRRRRRRRGRPGRRRRRDPRVAPDLAPVGPHRRARRPVRPRPLRPEISRPRLRRARGPVKRWAEESNPQDLPAILVFEASCYPCNGTHQRFNLSPLLQSTHLTRAASQLLSSVCTYGGCGDRTHKDLSVSPVFKTGAVAGLRLAPPERNGRDSNSRRLAPVPVLQTGALDH